MVAFDWGEQNLAEGDFLHCLPLVMKQSSLLGVEEGVAALQVFFLEHLVDVFVQDSADERVDNLNLSAGARAQRQQASK